MTKILAPLSVQTVAHDETYALRCATRERIFVDGKDEKNVSCAYAVYGEALHDVFVEVTEGTSCTVRMCYRAHEKGTKISVRISVLLCKDAKISLDVTSFCEEIAQESDVRIFVVFNEAAHATVRAFTRVHASQSVVHEEIRGLTLGESLHASFLPELSLLHDDVVATHATSVTKIDEKYIAYLQSRGIARERAVKEIAEAFLPFLCSLAEVFKQTEGSCEW